MPTSNKPIGSQQLIQAVLDDQRRMILVTSHRRENLGDGFQNICQALAELAERYPDVQFVYPVHLNPLVQEVVYGMLADKPNIYLVAPQDYPNFVWLMGRAHFILTDSGGVQEEAPAIGKPLLVLRDVTERPSVLESGTMLLVGTDKARIIKEAAQLLDDEETYTRMSRVHFPYGDGHASELIASRLHAWLSARSAAGNGV